MNKKLIMPKHLGIIMDGNGRWATNRGLNRSMGHKAGADTLKKLCLYMEKLGIEYVSLYAFSTENFKRNSKEVSFLMNLFIELFTNEFQVIIDNNIKVIFSGRRENLSKKVLDAMDEVSRKTSNNTGCVLNICLNYGSRFEIVDMTRKVCSLVVDGKLSIDDINIDTINKNLYQDIPDLDLVIRTGGESRLSNFMLYQASYAEFYFSKTLFPDFLEDDLLVAIKEYNNRTRKFGGNV